LFDLDFPHFLIGRMAQQRYVLNLVRARMFRVVSF
jgi:hypothetical protein